MVVLQTLATRGYKRVGPSRQAGRDGARSAEGLQCNHPLCLFPKTFRGAEEVAEGAGELTGFLKEVQV